jgi:hypothetical protein
MASGPWGLDLSGWIGVLVWVWAWSGGLVDSTHIGLGGVFASLAICFLRSGPPFVPLYLDILRGIFNSCAIASQLFKIHNSS